MLRWWLYGTLVCGCGRLGFSPSPDAAATADGARTGDGATDAAGDAPAGSMIVSFGERTGATHTNVTSDTGVSAAQPTFNFGGEDSVSSSPTATGLVRFDLGALPASTIVDAAELHLAVDTALTAGSAQLYAVLESWTEGTAMGAAGVANYSTRIGATPWTNAGAAPPGSRSATLLASFTPAQINADTTIPLDAAGVAAIQGWIATPTSNFGFAVVVSSGGGTWAFITRESTSPNLRPLLVLTVH